MFSTAFRVAFPVPLPRRGDSVCVQLGGFNMCRPHHFWMFGSTPSSLNAKYMPFVRKFGTLLDSPFCAGVIYGSLAGPKLCSFRRTGFKTPQRFLSIGYLLEGRREAPQILGNDNFCHCCLMVVLPLPFQCAHSFTT